MEVCFHIDTLFLTIMLLVDEHEIGVDFPTAICSHNYADMVALLGVGVNSGDAAIL